MLSRSRTVGYDEPISIACSLVSMVSVSMGLAHHSFSLLGPLSLCPSPPLPTLAERNYRQLPGTHATSLLPIACAPCKSFGLSLLRFFTCATSFRRHHFPRSFPSHCARCGKFKISRAIGDDERWILFFFSFLFEKGEYNINKQIGKRCYLQIILLFMNLFSFRRISLYNWKTFRSCTWQIPDKIDKFGQEKGIIKKFPSCVC